MTAHLPTDSDPASQPSGSRDRAAIEQRAVRGVPWTLLGFGLTKIVTLVATVVLARLLVPADFGLMALAMVAFGFIGLFRDLGLGATVVLRQNFDQKALGTVLSLMVVTALVLTGLVIATAPLAAFVLDEPRLTDVLVALSATSVFATLGWFYESMMQRELEFRKRFVALLVQSVGYGATAIVLAALGLGVWSLVLAQITSMVVYSMTAVAIAPRRVRPTFDSRVARDAMSAGSGFLLQGGLGWVQQNLDYLLVGRLLGTAQLGFYSMGYRLSELTYFGVADPIAKVTFPGFARMRERGQDVTAAFLSTLKLVGLVTVPVGVLLSATAEPFTRVVFGERWLPMIGVLSILGLWAAVKPVQSTIGWLLNSVGEALVAGGVAAILLVPTVPLLILASTLGGIEEVAWVVLGNCLASLAIFAWYARTRAGVSIGGQVLAVRSTVLAAPVAWAAAWGTVQLMSSTPPVISLVVSAAVGLGVFLTLASFAEPGLLRYALRQVGRTFGRESVPATGS